MERNICQTCLSINRRLIPLKRISGLIKEAHITVEMTENRGICWECHHIILKHFKFKLQVRKAQESIKCMEQDSLCLSKLSTVSKDCFDYQFAFNAELLDESEIKTDIKEEEDLNYVSENSIIEPKSDETDTYDTKPDINNDTANVFVDIDILETTQPVRHTSDDEIDHSEFNIKNTDSDMCKGRSLNCKSDVPTVNLQIKVREKRRKKEKVKISKIKKHENGPEIDETELRSKFAMVMYSAEEIKKHREDKRNHPNYKKLPFKCDSCVLGFTTKDNLNAHIEKKHNPESPYTCDVCLTRFANKWSLARHIAAHFACYRCALCAYETREEWSVLSHCRARHEADAEGRVHCPHCGIEATSREELLEHIKTQHVLYCDDCGEKFKARTTLRTHISRIHGVKREFVCDICNKTFKTKSRLESHTATHNPALAKKLAYCAVCNVQYKNLYIYRSHLRNSANHSERSYPCLECNKHFVSKLYRSKHYNFYHLGKSKFNCEICSKRFISEWRLKYHNQTQHGHSRSRDHSCNECGKKFFTMSTLRAHVLTHSTQRSYMCEDCGDTFKQRPALYNHTRRVHARQ